MLVPGISRRLHFYRSHPAFADDSPPAAPRTAGRSGRPGFLGSISFRSRFAGISDVQRGMYVTSVLLTALAAALLLAPVAYVHKPRRATRGIGLPCVVRLGPRSYPVWAALLWDCSTAPRIIGVARWIDRLTRCPGP
jgi:hypothetical protein